MVQVQPCVPDVGDRRVPAAADDRGPADGAGRTGDRGRSARPHGPGAAAREQHADDRDRGHRSQRALQTASAARVVAGDPDRLRAYTLDDAAAATATLNLKAALALDISPKRVRNGSVTTFRGRLFGGPGQFGTQVTIYAVGGRRAIPVETVPADRRGRFRYRYRFRSISGPTRFSIRAVVKRQPNYPYARGASAIVGVRARP